jgi:hypothetical protein
VDAATERDGDSGTERNGDGGGKREAVAAGTERLRRWFRGQKQTVGGVETQRDGDHWRGQRDVAGAERDGGAETETDVGVRQSELVVSRGERGDSFFLKYNN